MESGGALLTYDDIGFLGGTKEFMSAVKEKFPEINSQVYGFLDYWKEEEERFQFRTNWIPPLLTHLYGEKRCKELLQEVGSKFDNTGENSPWAKS
jgi:hypothetical protein